MRVIFDWLPFGFGVPILIATGFGLLNDEFRAFKASRICFYLGTAWIYGKVFMWAYFTPDRFQVRGVVAFLVFGLVGAGLIEALRLTSQREAKDNTPAVSTKPEAVYMQFLHTSLRIDPSTKRIFAVNRPAIVAVELQNASVAGLAREVVFFVGTAFIPTGEGLGTREEDEFNRFRSMVLSQLPKMRGDEIGPGQNRVRDAYTNPLQEELVKGLEHEQVYFYVFGIIKWTDEAGVWETQSCGHLLVKRSNLKGGLAVWEQCKSGEHNFIRHPFQLARE